MTLPFHGVTPGTEQPATMPPPAQFGSSLAWNGTHFIAAWTEASGIKSSLQVKSSVLSEDGAAVGTPLTLSGTAFQSEAPAVAVLNGIAVAGWLEQDPIPTVH